MALANRKQLPVALYTVCAAVLLVQKCTEKIMLINSLFPVNSSIQYSIYLGVKSRFSSNLFPKKLSLPTGAILEQSCCTRSVPDPRRNWETNAKVIFAELQNRMGKKDVQDPPPPHSTPSNTHYA
jgi:hypothetical protein